MTPQCDMQHSCQASVTHIGEKGFVYCTEHAKMRRGVERCRTMRVWELLLIRDGKPLPSYRPVTLAQARELAAARR